MRTTIDLPDELYRQVKARAALQGLKLKEYVMRALRESLYVDRSAGAVGEAQTEYETGVSVVSEECVLPLVEGDTTEVLRTISERKIDEVLADEDTADALLSSGR